MTLQTTNDSWEGLIHETFQTYISFCFESYDVHEIANIFPFCVTWYLNAIRELKNQLILSKF